MEYSIGELARRVGLSVKTVRFYSDEGIVPPVTRSPAGYRRYGVEAVARLELVRTLRELGVDLPTIQLVLDREVALGEVAATHAEALGVQIRTLKVRRAVLTAVADREATPEELELLHRAARLSEEGRQELVDDFLGSVFGELSPDNGFAGIAQSMTPELPDNPSTEQLLAWVELAALAQDPEFRLVLRRLVAFLAADATGFGRDAIAMVRFHVMAALSAGIPPESAEANEVIGDVAAQYGRVVGGDEREVRRRLLERLEAARDPRRVKYQQLLAVVNGWARPDDLTDVLEWAITAVRHAERAATPH